MTLDESSYKNSFAMGKFQPKIIHPAQPALARTHQPGQKSMRKMRFPLPRIKTANSYQILFRNLWTFFEFQALARAWLDMLKPWKALNFAATKALKVTILLA